MVRSLMLVVGMTLGSFVVAQTVTTERLFTVDKLDEGMAVVVDGRTYQPYQRLLSPPLFTADRSHWLLVLSPLGPGNAAEVLLDGRSVLSTDRYASFFSPALKADGSSWALRADVGGPERARQVNVIDGRPYGPFDSVGDVLWAPRGSRWVFPAQKGNDHFLVVDGKTVGPFSMVRQWGFSADGQSLWYEYGNAKGAWLRVKDKDVGPYNQTNVVLLADGTAFGAVGRTSANAYELYIGDKKYGPYSYVNDRIDYVSADGKDWLTRVYKKNGQSSLLQNGKETAYNRLWTRDVPRGWLFGWENGMQGTANLNGTVIGPFEDRTGPFVMANGTSWSIAYTVPEPTVVVNGQSSPGFGLHHIVGTGEAFTWLSGGRDSDLIYHRYDTRETARVLYSVTRESAGVVVTVGGKTLGPYLEIRDRPVSNAAGTHWGFVAREAEDRFTVVIDGQEVHTTEPYGRQSDFSMADNGAAWSFVVAINQNNDKPQFRIVNGQVLGPYDWAGSMRYSLDGKTTVFQPTTLAKGNPTLLNLNGKDLGLFASGPDLHQWDPTRGNLALVFRGKAGTTVQLNGDTFGPYRDAQLLVGGTHLTDASREDGALLGFAGQLTSGAWEVHVAPGVAGAGQVYGPYSRVASSNRQSLPADLKDWFLAAERDGQNVLLHNGVEIADALDILPLARGYFLALRGSGGSTIVDSGTTYGPWSSIDQYHVSSDGAVWVAQVQKGEGPQSSAWIVVNGREYPGEALTYENTATAEAFRWYAFDAQDSVRQMVRVR